MVVWRAACVSSPTVNSHATRSAGLGLMDCRRRDTAPPRLTARTSLARSEICDAKFT